MKRLLFASLSQRRLAKLHSFIVRSPPVTFPGQLRSYSLTREVAERIKGQLDHRDARLLIPEDANPSSVYKGLVILAAGPISKYPVLKHFSVPYLESGLPVITMNHSMASFGFCTPAQYKMSRVFNVVCANLSEPCPVVMKLYCSGLNTYFPAAAEQFSKPGCKLKLVGAIFDSGPPTMTPIDIINVSRVFALQNRYPTWYHQLKEIFMPLLLATLNGQRKRAALERVMYGPFLHHTPQLYVYSTSDEIIIIDYINKLIGSQRHHNADVTTHTFSDTIHMLHRLKYPKEYDNLVFDFLRKKCNLSI